MTKKAKDTVIVTLSGPMRGYEDWNYPLFHEVACAWLDQHPHDKVLNPAKNYKGRQDLPIEAYMQKSLEQVLACNFLVLLPGWENSEGAQHEVRVAKATGKIFYIATLTVNRDGTDRSLFPYWRFEYTEHDEIDAMLEPVEQEVYCAEHDNYVCDVSPAVHSPVRRFESGATRDTEDGKLDYEAFLSPAVLRVYADYMHKHRKTSDGGVRAGDDWQKGIPTDVYMKSMWRHFMDVWSWHRDVAHGGESLQEAQKIKADALCGVMFNAMGYLHQLLKDDQ